MGNAYSCIYLFSLWLHWGDVKRRMTWGRDKGLNRKGTGKEMQPEEHLRAGGKTLDSPVLACSPTKKCGGEDATRTLSGKSQSWWEHRADLLGPKPSQSYLWSFTKDTARTSHLVCLQTENSLGDSDVLIWGVTIHDLSQWYLILRCHKRTLLQPFGFSRQTILAVTNYKQSLRKWEREMHS